MSENSFSLGSHEALVVHHQTEQEVEELEAALSQETDPEKCEELERKISWRKGMLENREERQAAYTQLGEDYLGPVADYCLSPIENEFYRGLMEPWNESLEGVHRWSDGVG